MPLVAPLAEILRNSRSFEPMVVLATLRAVPVLVVNALTTEPVEAGLQGFSSQTLTVPPPVAVKAGLVPVESESPPEKVIVAPVLPAKEIPVLVPPLSVIAPLKVCVLDAVTFCI